jgi:hypothetical protein
MRFRVIDAMQEEDQRRPAKQRLCPYPVIEPRHLVGKLQECLWRGGIPPKEDVVSAYTQQDGQQ